MKPRPIYRWKSFWLGLVVLVFMGWASWKSQRGDRLLKITGDQWGLQVGKYDGGTAFATGLYSEFHGKWKIGYETMRSGSALLHLEVLRDVARQYGVRFVTVPDQLLFFCFLGLWGGWLIWQWSREQKKLE